MRGALAEIDGVEDIQTDIDDRLCTFRITNPEVDYKSKLAELAKSHHHLADYEIQ